MALPHTQSLELELANGWLTIWFNQPERRNPLTDGVIRDLNTVIDAVVDDRSIRGITVRGRGGVFCAGGDLKSFRSLSEGPREASIETSSLMGRLLSRFNHLPQITVAIIEGAAMAGGLGLACCCDVTIGTHDAKFAFSETRIGITPAQIAPFVLDRCGLSVGRRLMLTAARFEGAEAAKLGLLDQVADSVEELNALEMAVRNDVLCCAPGAVAASKALINMLPSLDGETRVRYAAENFTDCLQGKDGQEGLASFLEKRKPIWAMET